MSLFFKSTDNTSNVYSITRSTSAKDSSIMPQVDQARILMAWTHQILEKAIKDTATLLELYQLRSVLKEAASVKALQEVHPKLQQSYLVNIDGAINSLVNKQRQNIEQEQQTQHLPTLRIRG